MPIEEISLVVPCYNEEQVLEKFHERAGALAENNPAYRFHFLFINDGSTDKTREILDRLAQADKRVQVLHLAGNRGHQAAITAGIDFANGDLVVIMDADLQDPPELVPQMIEKAEAGYDVIHAQRTNRRGETLTKRFTAWAFYKLMRFLSRRNLVENCGDFRAFTQRVAQAIRAYPEPHRYIRGLFVDVGFRQCTLPYERDPRLAGETKYPYLKSARLAITAVISFSAVPLKMILLLSFFLWGISLFYLIVALYYYFILQYNVPGWTSLIILIIFFSGLQLFCLGILGTYVGKIFEQGQHRPLYWVASTRNIAAPPAPAPPHTPGTANPSPAP